MHFRVVSAPTRPFNLKWVHGEKFDLHVGSVIVEQLHWNIIRHPPSPLSASSSSECLLGFLWSHYRISGLKRYPYPLASNFILKLKINRSSSIKTFKKKSSLLSEPGFENAAKRDRTSGSCHVCGDGAISERTNLLQPAQQQSEWPFLEEERKIIYFILCVMGRENVRVTPYIKHKPI